MSRFLKLPKSIFSPGIFFLGLVVTFGVLVSLVIVTRVYAGTPTNAYSIISDSRAAQSNVNLNIGYTATVSTGIKQITMTFCTTASGTCTAPPGLSLLGSTVAADNISGTGVSSTAVSANQINLNIATTATQNPLGIFTNITGMTSPTGPNVSTFVRIVTYSDVGVTQIDTVTTAFAVLANNSISVTASVDPIFTFSVAGVAAASLVNGATTNIGTAATSVPFGTIAASATYIAANDLTVTTNAVNGYKITVNYPSSQSYPLTSGSNGISAFTGTNGSPTTWSLPNGTVANTNTGWFGYTSNHAGVNQFSSNKWAGPLTTSANIALSTVPVSAETTRVGWQIEINGIQPQGNYSGTMVLVATPTY